MFPLGRRASNSADLDLVKSYVDTTDSKTAATSRAGLIARCTRVLEGQATRGTTKQVVEVIRWQEKQTLIVRFILRDLFTQGLLMELFDSEEDVEDRIDDLDNRSREILHLVNDRLWQFSRVRDLMQPRDPSFRVLFQEAYDYLRGTVALNCLRHPDIGLELIARFINWKLETLEHAPPSVFGANETV